ncbi:MAG: transglycosylase SLT domain-containing protein [Xanthobacteraceae bacterium]
MTGAIRQAARMTGANFQYLLAAARIESNFNPNAKVSTSSARGLFQFIEQTWLATLKEKGPALGYGPYAEAIARLPSGRYAVSNPAMRGAILNLRADPTASALMAGAFTNKNASMLAARLGRDATEGELYLAHFLGANGAGRLIGLAESRPQTPAAAAFPGAARANRTIFYDRRGEARSVGDVYRSLVGRYDVARAKTANTLVAERASGIDRSSAIASVPDPAAVAETQTIAAPPLPAAVSIDGRGPVFRDLFQAGARRAPVAPVVTALWSAPTPSSTPDTAADAAPRPAAARRRAPVTGRVNVLDLFRDQATDVSALFRGRG